MLNCSDIILFSCVQTLIAVSRNKMGESHFHIQILTFFFDHINMLNPTSPCVNFKNINEFHTILNTYVHDSPISITYIRNKLMLKSVDDLITLFQDVRETIFNNDPLVETSALSGPTLLCPDSLLGVYVRTTIVKWENLDFEDICDLFELFSQFCQNSPINNENLLNRATYKKGFIEDVNESLQKKDIYSAVEKSHNYYDSTLLNGVPSTISSKKHQQAMLTQTINYIKCKLYDTALISLDEVIKIAHNRSDHTVIAQAIELLYHISIEKTENNNRDTMEDLLKQSIMKYIDLNMQYASVKATCYLICHNIKYMKTRHKYHSLWMFLQASLLGEVKGIKRTIESSSLKQTWICISSNSDSLQVKSDQPLPFIESCSILLQYHLTTAQIWISKHSYSLGILQLQRAVSTYQYYNVEDTCIILLQIARLKSQFALHLIETGGDDRLQSVHRLCEQAESIVSQVRLILQQLQPQEWVALEYYLKYTEVFVNTHKQIVLKDWISARINIGVLVSLINMEGKFIQRDDYFHAKLLIIRVICKVNKHQEARKQLISLEMEAADVGIQYIREMIDLFRIKYFPE